MPWGQRKSCLPTIVKVGALDGDCFDVTLSNGHSIFLEFSDRINDPDFAPLIENRSFDRPFTDGKRLYWVNGPSFTVEDILCMLAQDNKKTADKAIK